MNPLDDQLKRLFRAAALGMTAQGRPAPVDAPPYGLETQVMAAWRAAQSAQTGFWDMTLLVRGLICASVIMAVSFWPALNGTTTTSTTNPFTEYLQLTDSTIPSDEAP
jgi:hypothetical protein